MTWLDDITLQIAETAGCDASALAITGVEVTALLDASRVAAHTSGDRINAPLVCYVIGRAAALSERPASELAEVIKTPDQG